MSRQAFLSRRVVTPQGIKAAAILVEDGRILDVVSPDQLPAKISVQDLGDAAILPGLVDSHVHINEPGRTEWEGFRTATRAAAAGGYTLLVDMPLNCLPPTTTVAALEAKRNAASGQCHVDWMAWGGVVSGNQDHIESLGAAGVPGFKCFLIHPGIDGFTMVTEPELRTALPHVARTGLPLLVHAELPEPVGTATRRLSSADWSNYSTYLRSRPDEAELSAIRLLLALCREFHFRLHIVHLATSQALDMLRAAKSEGLPVTVETCPHYLPCPPEMKRLSERNFQTAWGGIAGLSLALPVMWTEASARGFTLTDIARWMAEGPARLAGGDSRKGRIAKGFDADLVVFEPDAEFIATENHLHYRHRVSPYLGETLRGVVMATYLRGDCVFSEGDFPGEPKGREFHR